MRQTTNRILLLTAIMISLAYGSACKSQPAPAPVESPQPSAPRLLPEAQGYVSDFANKLSAGTKQKLETQLTDFVERGGIDLSVVTIPFDELQGMAVEDYSLQMGRQWGIGHGPDKLGALLLLAIKPQDSDGTYHGSTRLELSRNLEPDLPNDQAREIIGKMRNDFQAGRFDQALTLGVNEIISTLTQKRSIPAGK